MDHNSTIADAEFDPPFTGLVVALGRHNGEAIMTKVLKGKRIAILATNGVEESELVEPRKALDNAGAKTELISPASGKIQAMNHKAQGDTFEVDLPLDEANAEDYDALLLPGGVANPDELRTEAKAVDLVRAIFRANLLPRSVTDRGC
jgi:protease I